MIQEALSVELDIRRLSCLVEDLVVAFTKQAIVTEAEHTAWREERNKQKEEYAVMKAALDKQVAVFEATLDNNKRSESFYQRIILALFIVIGLIALGDKLGSKTIDTARGLISECELAAVGATK